MGVRVQVPVLGTVTGLRPLSEIIAGTPEKPPSDEPAVATRDMGQPIRTVAARPPVRPAPTPTVSPKPTPTVAPNPKPAATPDASGADPEAEAKRLMQLAENYIRAGLKPMALKKLKEIVKKYPKTNTAIDAELKIEELE